MDSFDKALLELTEKQLLILNLRIQANILHRIKRLENMSDLIQKHLLPKEADDFYQGTGNTCGTFIEMLEFAAKTDCGRTGDNNDVDKMIEGVTNEINWFKERFM